MPPSNIPTKPVSSSVIAWRMPQGRDYRERAGGLSTDSPLHSSGSWQDTAYPQTTVPTVGDVRPWHDANNDRAA